MGRESLGTLNSKLQATQGERVAALYLVELNADGSPNTGELRRFQWYPESLQDSKAINYQQKEVPGGSLPLYQWVNSGERLISFTVVFTSDVNITEEDTASLDSAADATDKAGEARRNIDIRSAIAWLRRYMHPTYKAEAAGVGVVITEAPRRLLLVAPGTGIGIAGGDATSKGDPHSIDCVMTQCDVVYEDLFANGAPRIAEVQLSFAQLAQRAGMIEFPSDSDVMKRAVTGGDDLPKFVGYKLTSK